MALVGENVAIICDRISLYIPGCPEICSGRAGLTPTEIHLPLCDGIKSFCHHDLLKRGKYNRKKGICCVSCCVNLDRSYINRLANIRTLV